MDTTTKLPTRNTSTATEREGVNYVRSVVEGANSIFHQIHVEDDYGNDALLELVDGTDVTGRMVAVQIKSGNSFCTKTHCVIPAKESQLNYWRSHSLEVIGIVYDPDEGTAYWGDIKKRVLSREFEPPLRFEKTELCRFDDDSFARIFLPTFLRRPVRLEFDTAARLARDARRELHTVGLSALLHAHRHELRTWVIFAELLRDRPASEIDPNLVYILAMVPGHGDIYWHAGNIISEELRKQVKAMMAGWKQPEIVPLLRLMEMWDVGRGTIGQNVYAIVDLAISTPGPKLRSIIEDNNIEAESRKKALFLFCLVVQSDAVSLLAALDAKGEFPSEVTEFQRILREYGFFPTQ